MTLRYADLKPWAAGLTWTDDSSGPVGGAIERTMKVNWTQFDPGSDVQVVSSDDFDYFLFATIYSREDPSGVPQICTGTVPNAFGVATADVQYATFDSFASGDIAFEQVDSPYTGTLDSGGNFTAVLPSGASAVDNFYLGWVFRETNGDKRIRWIIDYVGSTRTVTFSRAFATSPPSGSTTFRLSKGIVMDNPDAALGTNNNPNYVLLPFAFATPGSPIYVKWFIRNHNTGDSLTSGAIEEVSGGASGHCEFALETTMNGSGNNGGSNPRTTAPTSGVTSFDSSSKALPATLGPSDRIGVWIKYTPTNETSTYTLRLTGTGNGGAWQQDYQFIMEAVGSSSHDYDPSGGIEFGGAAVAVFSNASGYRPTGGIAFGGAATVEKTLSQINFQILQAQSYPLPVFFSIINSFDPPESITATFDIYAGPNGVQASFDIFADKLHGARTNEDVQQPIAEVDLL